MTRKTEERPEPEVQERPEARPEPEPREAAPAPEAQEEQPEQEGKRLGRGKKKAKEKKPLEIPTIEQLEAELGRERYRHRYRSVLRSTIYALITVAAAAVLVATLWMPVLQISGNSMTPTLVDGEIVLSLKGSSFRTGDIVAFYFDNKILIKRVIAGPGDWVNIDEQGTVFVNDEMINEPYLVEKALGNCDIELPYQVPESKVFVMGDHRSVSLDSRSSAIGCVGNDQIVGRLLFRIWPYNVMGPI